MLALSGILVGTPPAWRATLPPPRIEARRRRPILIPGPDQCL
ncbi:MAG: hypothetical protein AVDCRST_MAG68-235 [uncultured Gemmatimonadetes bacterium]|uniref:Uncharacterized protein n=1 Tax=uncultured Gemmatimonadota bacterium TaxID=203437 RepID=A0A6J4KA04_9BACT|nr:MAG: hypothetical protein AVDCRST_MAG68-235 [uncultured Gemmatimonadota bacterium]